MRRVFTVGATAQAKLCRQFLATKDYEFPLVYDRNSNVEKPWECVLVHELYPKDCDSFMVCIGGDNGRDRTEYAKALLQHGLKPIDIIHESAITGDTNEAGHGIQIMPGAVLSENIKIGDWCILNTNCTIDHDCYIGNGVHIMPGATLAGCVWVGDYATIGTNATILPWLTIGNNCYIGAGAVVLNNVPNNAVVVGNPARLLRYKDQMSKVA